MDLTLVVLKSTANFNSMAIFLGLGEIFIFMVTLELGFGKRNFWIVT